MRNYPVSFVSVPWRLPVIICRAGSTRIRANWSELRGLLRALQLERRPVQIRRLASAIWESCLRHSWVGFHLRTLFTHKFLRLVIAEGTGVLTSYKELGQMNAMRKASMEKEHRNRPCHCAQGDATPQRGGWSPVYSRRGHCFWAELRASSSTERPAENVQHAFTASFRPE